MISQIEDKVTMKERIGYAMGDYAGNLMWQSVMLYLMIFYTDVVGFAPVAVSVLFLVARIWDAINDPIMGVLIDKTNTRDGKMRPWLKWCAIPAALICPLCFFSPDISMTGKLVWAYITYILFGMCITAYNTPYSALPASMTLDPKERGRLAATRMIGSRLGMLTVSILIPVMVIKFNERGLSTGNAYLVSAAIFGVFTGVMLYLCFKMTKERYSVPGSAKFDKETILNCIFKNKPYLAFLLMFFLFQLTLALCNSVNTYLFRYFFMDFGALATFNSAQTITTLISLFFIPSIISKVDRKIVFIIGVFGMMVVPVYLLFCPATADAMKLAIVLSGVSGFFWGCVFGTSWSFLGDTIDCGELISGTRLEGLQAAIAGFVQKTGITIAGIVPGIVLQATGYVANAQQTEDAVMGIRILNSVFPLALMILLLVAVIIYPLNDKRCNENFKKLMKKKKESFNSKGV